MKHKISPALNNPSPSPPWAVRRQRLINLIAERLTGLPVNIKWCFKTNTNEPMAVDLRRLIKEGYAVLSLQPIGSHPKPHGAIIPKRLSKKTVRVLNLTEKGSQKINVTGLLTPKRNGEIVSSSATRTAPRKRKH